MQVPEDFEQTLEHLREPGLSKSVLYKLSNLHGPELSLLRDGWPSLPVERRRSIASDLIEIAEDNFEVDFAETFKICLDDEDPQVRAAAIEGLWEVNDVVLVRPLVRTLRDDPSVVVRESAAMSLSRFALLAELERLQPRLVEMVWNALWDALHDEEEDLVVRRRAVESIAYFDRAEVAEIIERAYQDEEVMMRISAIFAMGRSADERWSDVVIAELDAEDPEVRYEAARACGALRVAEAVPILSKRVADVDLEVRLAAIWALGQIGGPGAQRVLEICSEQGDEALQDAAKEAIEGLEFAAERLEFPMYDFDLDAEDNDQDLELWEDEEDNE